VIFGDDVGQPIGGVGLLHGTVIDRQVSAARPHSVMSFSCLNAACLNLADMKIRRSLDSALRSSGNRRISGPYHRPPGTLSEFTAQGLMEKTDLYLRDCAMPEMK
jgi:hypothetical protein